MDTNNTYPRGESIPINWGRYADLWAYQPTNATMALQCEWRCPPCGANVTSTIASRIHTRDAERTRCRKS